MTSVLRVVLTLLALAVRTADQCTGGFSSRRRSDRADGWNGLVGGEAHLKAFSDASIGDSIKYVEDLDCFDWHCRWHNGVDGLEDDQDFKMGDGQPDGPTWQIVTTCSQFPEAPYAVVHPDLALPSTDRAFLISDPVKCQKQQGSLTFDYWISPNAQMRVCIRDVAAIEPNSCGEYINGPACGSTTAVIPGPVDLPFEIIIEANTFDDRDDFLVVDNLIYEGELCDGMDLQDFNKEFKGFNEFNENGLQSLFNSDYDSNTLSSDNACSIVQCNFDKGEVCVDFVADGWAVGRGLTGNPITGIPMDPFGDPQGNYAWTQGPANQDGKHLLFDRFTVSQDVVLEYDLYKASFGAVFEVLLDGVDVFVDRDISVDDKNNWSRHAVEIGPGEHVLEYVARDLGRFDYIAIDNLLLFGTDGRSLC